MGTHLPHHQESLRSMRREGPEEVGEREEGEESGEETAADLMVVHSLYLIPHWVTQGGLNTLQKFLRG